MDKPDIHSLRRSIADLRRRAQSAIETKEVDRCLIEADKLQMQLNNLAGTLTVTKITGWKLCAWAGVNSRRINDLEQAIQAYRSHNGMVHIYVYFDDGRGEQRRAVHGQRLIDLGFTWQQ